MKLSRRQMLAGAASLPLLAAMPARAYFGGGRQIGKTAAGRVAIALDPAGVDSAAYCMAYRANGLIEIIASGQIVRARPNDRLSIIYDGNDVTYTVADEDGLRYLSKGGRLYCRHGLVLYGDGCAICDRSA